MAQIFIDNQPYEVDDKHNLLHAGLSLGLDIPYFCWHPALGSVGACRLCAVKQFRDENDTKGRLVMACMTPAVNGSRISIADGEAREFRQTILEWLMVNHPHDCPVCDEGGECHLQDMTVMTGHTYRRFRFKKRTYRNQYLGPFINHEMNRCIQCYRCVRYYRDYAGGDDLQVFAAHDHVYFGRSQPGVLESEFSGNLVEVCPTGVFTDKTLGKHYTRKWDLQTAPSVCVHCSVGCNTIPGERYGTIRRIRTRYNSEVNRYFLCDRGRYGYEFVNNPQRILQPLLHANGNGAAKVIGKSEALERLGQTLAKRGAVIGIGSPRASLEANFALRTLVGPDRFYNGLSATEAALIPRILEILQNGPARSPSLHDIQQADAVLVLGEDVTNTAPMVALALRQSVRQQPMDIPRGLKIPDWEDRAVREVIQDAKGPLFIATPAATRLDDAATQTYWGAPDDIARLGFAVAQALDSGAPTVPGLDSELEPLVQQIAQTLQGAKRPLIVSGTSLGSEAVIQAAANIAWALHRQGRSASLSYVVGNCNSLGVGLFNGQNLEAAKQAVTSGSVETVIVLENDLYTQVDAALVDALLASAKQVIVIDHLQNETTSRATLVLPAATFADGDGTLVNNEGRAQRFYQVFPSAGEVQESWRWLADLMRDAGRPEAAGWQRLEDVTLAMAEAVPVFKETPTIVPPAGFRIAGQPIARQPHRYSGRTAMFANRTVHEPKPASDPDSPLVFTMEGFHGPAPAAVVPEFWAPGWNSIQSVNKFQIEIGGPLHGGDPGRRLIEPAGGAGFAYFEDVPAAFKRRDGQWLLMPLYHIFGSEPLSMFTPGLAELAPQPYLALNPADAEQLGLAEASSVAIELEGLEQQLPLKLVPSLPPGLAGLPAGLPGLTFIRLPRWSKLQPAGHTGGER